VSRVMLPSVSEGFAVREADRPATAAAPSARAKTNATARVVILVGSFIELRRLTTFRGRVQA
jgi:hypothetical protein